MTLLTLEGVVTFLTFLAAVGGAYQGTPSYYWSRTKSGTAHVSRRAHVGPLPHVNDVMTEWSSWGSWARCSRSCGGGVRSRARTCVAKYPRVMPGSGIRTSHDHCSGDSVEYGLCGSRPCLSGQVSALSFRAAQCRIYNNRKVFGRVVNNWVPYMQGGMNPCSLVCEGEGQGVVYTFGKVTDGTHCKTSGQERDGLCVNGRCMPLSCDGRLGGSAREDMCRVCAGRNDTCTHHVGVYHTDLPYSDSPLPPPPLEPPPVATPSQEQLIRPRQRPQRRRLGYYEVTKIPRGATNVRVRDQSPNFLALKSDGKFLLNGDWLIDWPGEVEAAGSSFTYLRDEDDSETLTALGPTTDTLTLMVLLREHNPGISYEYWIPNPVTTTTTTTTTTTRPPAPASLILNTTSTAAHHHHHHTPPRRRAFMSVAGKVKALNETLRGREAGVGRGFRGTPPGSPNSLSAYRWKARGLRRGSGEWDSQRWSSRGTSHYRHENEAYLVPSKDRALKKHNSKDGRGGGGVEKEEEGENKITESQDLRRKGKEKKKTKKRREKKKKKKRRRGGKKWRKEGEKKEEEEKEEEEEGRCPPCKRPRRKTREIFCLSDFVSRVEVLGEDEVMGRRRFEVLIRQSYKNTVPLLHKEFLWAPDSCRCPRLRRGLSYLVMGVTEASGGREVRLVLGPDSYVKKYRPRHLARILRVRHNEMRFCRPWRRDLSFHTPGHALSSPPSSPPPPVARPMWSGGGGGGGGSVENSVLVNASVVLKS